MANKGKFSRSWRQVVVFTVSAAVAVLAVRACVRTGTQASQETFRRAQVIRQDLQVTKTATGVVTPQNRVEVKPPIAGRIEEVLVREGDVVTQGQILAWMSSAERAALLDAARSQGPETMARWESAYKPAPLMSPLDGSVIVRAVEPGQTVTISDPVVVVADRLIVKAQVDETDIGALAVGQPAAITLDAYPQETIPAHVDHVAYEAKTVNNVTIYEVDVLPEKVPEFMRSGMTATITITVSAKTGALVVPAEAIQQDTSGATILVPGSSPFGRRPAQKQVATGLTDGKWTEVVSGLEEGDTILAPSLNLPRASGTQRSSPLSPFRGRRPSQTQNRR